MKTTSKTKIGLLVDDDKWFLTAECHYMRNAQLKKEWRIVSGIDGFLTRKEAILYYRSNAESIQKQLSK